MIQSPITYVTTYSITNRGALESVVPTGVVPFYEDNTLTDGEEVGDDGIGGVPIENAAICFRHAIACSSNGMAYTWGTGGDGVLGNPGIESHSSPIPIPLPDLCRERIKQVAVGRSHTLALTDRGIVYGWGSDNYGQVGVRSFSSAQSSSIQYPTMISITAKKTNDMETITRISAGAEFSGAVSKSGNLYTWGCGNNGQLGRGMSGWTMSDIRPVQPEAGKTVVWAGVACGDQHTVGWSRSGVLYSWGFDGLGGAVYYPCKVMALLRVRVHDGACGKRSTLVLTRSGIVYMWGKFGDQGQLGAVNTKQISPALSLLDKRCIQVACGTRHAAVLLEGGKLKHWHHYDGHISRMQHVVERDNIKSVDCGDGVSIFLPQHSFSAESHQNILRFLGCGINASVQNFSTRFSRLVRMSSKSKSFKSVGQLSIRQLSKFQTKNSQELDQEDLLQLEGSFSPEHGHSQHDEFNTDDQSIEVNFVDDVDSSNRSANAAAEDSKKLGSWKIPGGVRDSNDRQTDMIDPDEDKEESEGDFFTETSLRDHLSKLLWSSIGADIVVFMKSPKSGSEPMQLLLHYFVLSARAPALVNPQASHERLTRQTATRVMPMHVEVTLIKEEEFPTGPSEILYKLDLSDYSAASVLLYANYLYTGEIPELTSLERTIQNQFASLKEGRINSKQSGELKLKSEASELNDCSICLEPMTKSKDELNSCSVCRNNFHKTCISGWRDRQGLGSVGDVCPICKQAGTFGGESEDSTPSNRPPQDSLIICTHQKAQLNLSIFETFGSSQEKGICIIVDGAQLPACNRFLLMRYPVLYSYLIKQLADSPQRQLISTVPISAYHMQAILHYVYGRDPDNVMCWEFTQAANQPHLRDMLEFTALAAVFELYNLQFMLETEIVLLFQKLAKDCRHKPSLHVTTEQVVVGSSGCGIFSCMPRRGRRGHERQRARQPTNDSMASLFSSGADDLYHSEFANALPDIREGQMPSEVDLEWLAAQILLSFMDFYRNALRMVYSKEGQHFSSKPYENKIANVGERLRAGLVSILNAYVDPDRLPTRVWGFSSIDIVRELNQGQQT
mmetsp:Transcript_12627/g.16582  ORF Transcript_12627/g.16582 Transcript_12627/m.16582 type:complete len:1070 (+) Transcript_12627:147-3356(+)